MALCYPPKHDPIYNGKRLTVWLENYSLDATDAESRAADEAVRHLGTNAIPTLLRLLRASDSPVKVRFLALLRKQHLFQIGYPRASLLNGRAAWGFRALGPDAEPAVPALMKIYQQDISPFSRVCTVEALGYIGPHAKAAVPLLISAVTNVSVRRVDGPSDSTIGVHAIQALGRIHEAPEQVLPVLMPQLKDAYAGRRLAAAHALGEYGSDAKVAMTALVGLLGDGDEFVRREAVSAIGRIDGQSDAPELRSVFQPRGRQDNRALDNLPAKPPAGGQ